MDVRIDLLGLLIAALGGAAVGLERQRSGHADGPRARFAGFRTFTMLGGVGGLSGALWDAGLAAPAVVLLAGAMALIAGAYARASRHDIDGTTEVAAIVVVASGLLAGLGSYQVASGVIALTCLILIEKSRLHSLAASIDDVGLRAGVHFAALALVVLPLLPEGPYGPFGGVRPRELWALVLFFSGLSFTGYIAQRVVGPSHGYFVAGLAGGLVSSTNTTLRFARLSRTEPSADRALAFGAVAANAMLYPRVLVATAVLNLPLLPVVFPYLAGPAVVALGSAAIGLRQSRTRRAHAQPVKNPLQLKDALQMAVLFQGVLMLLFVARSRWGESGIRSFAAALGLTDVDALTVSMAREVAKTVSLATAAAAIAIGVASNTMLKLGVAIVFGNPTFRRIAGGTLALMAVVAVIAIVLRDSR